MAKHFSLFGQKMFYNLSHLIESTLVLGLLVNLPISQPFFNQLKRFIFIGHQTYSLFPRTSKVLVTQFPQNNFFVDGMPS